MFGQGLSVVRISGETFYVSPIYKKDKVRPVNKVKHRNKHFYGINAVDVSRLNRMKMKELFGEIPIEDSLPRIYDDSEMRYLSDYIFMGRYYDDYV